MLCWGVYRFRDEHNSGQKIMSPSSKRYVICNPSADFVLIPTDLIYVLEQFDSEHARSKRDSLNNSNSGLSEGNKLPSSGNTKGGSSSVASGINNNNNTSNSKPTTSMPKSRSQSPTHPNSIKRRPNSKTSLKKSTTTSSRVMKNQSDIDSSRIAPLASDIEPLPSIPITEANNLEQQKNEPSKIFANRANKNMTKSLSKNLNINESSF
jgi:hypothetical protein